MLPILMLFVLSLLLDEVASQGMSRGRSAAIPSVKGLTLLSQVYSYDHGNSGDLSNLNILSRDRHFLGFTKRHGHMR